MADTTTTSFARVSFPGLIIGFFQSIWNGLVYLGETSARARILQDIHNMSDLQLEAIGVTREELVKRVLSDNYQI